MIANQILKQIQIQIQNMFIYVYSAYKYGEFCTNKLTYIKCGLLIHKRVHPTHFGFIVHSFSYI